MEWGAYNATFPNIQVINGGGMGYRGDVSI